MRNIIIHLPRLHERSYIFLCVLTLTVGGPHTVTAQCTNDAYADGEVLRYAVRWGFLRLGTVEIHQQMTVAAEDRYQLLLKVHSAPHLPFIDVNFDNRSEQVAHVHGLRHEVVTTSADTTEYWFDESSGAYITEDRSDGVVVWRDTVKHTFPLFDALGLFMIARCLSDQSVDTSLATLLEHSCHATDIRTGISRESIVVDAFPGLRDAVVLEGYAHWTGTGYAGLTGYFRGWISDDTMAIPLRAEFEIFLGSIALELESFERHGAQSAGNASTLSVPENAGARP